MNKYQLEVENQILKNEKQILKELKNNYVQALKEIKVRITDLQSNDLTQSKIYQLQYQKNLEKQLQSIVDLLSTDNLKSINDYLVNVYQDGFIGTLYNMQNEGIPFIMPINQEVVIKSITKRIEDFKLSERIYENAKELKKLVKSEITRGISQGLTYSKISQKIALDSEADLKKSYRIARTEGGRVVSEARFEVMQRAKANGADVVKQWDSTIDKRTREMHAKLDGQIREIEEAFEVQGHKAMYPHGFGIASEDINCRCVVLERARWGIEDDETFTKVVDGDIVEFPNVKNYQDYKEKYFDFYKEHGIINNIPKNISDFYQYITKNDKIKEITTFKQTQNDGVIRGKELNKILGYDKLPTIVSKEEFEQLAQGSSIGKLYRGVQADTKELGQKYVNDFKYGQLYAGKGVYGNGTYVAHGEEGLKIVKTNYTNEKGNVMTMLLDNDAKTINFVELDKMRREEIKLIDGSIPENFKNAMLMDNGYYASIKGYDAIVLDKTIADLNNQPYIVILNRGKVIISE